MPIAAFPKCFIQDLCVHRTMTVDQWIDMSADFDIDGLEFYWPSTPWQDKAELERLRKRVEAQGRSIPMMCYSPDFTKPDQAERRNEVENQKRVIETCAVLGTQFCRVLSGQRRQDVGRQDGIAWVQECIHELLDFAGKHQVTLIIENHYKDSFWTAPEFAQKMDVFLELLEGIAPSPWFGVNYDPSNCIIAGEDPIELLEAVKERVVTMHASDRYFEGGTFEDLVKLDAEPLTGYAGILRHGVVGQGMNDYDRIFSILKGAGFKGWVSIEDGEDPAKGAEDIAESAVFLRKRMKEHGLR